MNFYVKLPLTENCLTTTSWSNHSFINFVRYPIIIFYYKLLCVHFFLPGDWGPLEHFPMDYVHVGAIPS